MDENLDRTEPAAVTVPDRMPVLSRGKHRDPARGACFMEYTALLAGGPFTDAPRCVDPELATVLRGANDKLPDEDRARLVPLLGRAIGLAVEPPRDLPRGFGLAAVRRRRQATAPYREQAARLRREAARRFLAGIGPTSATATRSLTTSATARPSMSTPSTTTRTPSGCSGELSELFWDTMTEPTATSRSPEYVQRLVERLHLLHTAYEQAMVALGLPRATTTPAAPAPAGPARRQATVGG